MGPVLLLAARRRQRRYYAAALFARRPSKARHDDVRLHHSRPPPDVTLPTRKRAARLTEWNGRPQVTFGRLCAPCRVRSRAEPARDGRRSPGRRMIELHRFSRNVRHTENDAIDDTVLSEGTGSTRPAASAWSRSGCLSTPSSKQGQIGTMHLGELHRPRPTSSVVVADWMPAGSISRPRSPVTAEITRGQ